MLGGCGRSRDQSCPSVDKAGQGPGRGAWSVREEQVKQWAAETLVALEALHEQGVLCRDLNPRNLLLDQAGRCPGLGEGEYSVGGPQSLKMEESATNSRERWRLSASPALF